MTDLEITPRQVKDRLDRGEKLLLVDVREPHEHAVCRIEGALLIPMGTIPANLQKLDSDEDVICFCHHGMRSLDVANGSAIRASNPPSPWPVASIAGPPKLIPPSPVIDLRLGAPLRLR